MTPDILSIANFSRYSLDNAVSTFACVPCLFLISAHISRNQTAQTDIKANWLNHSSGVAKWRFSHCGFSWPGVWQWQQWRIWFVRDIRRYI